MEPEAVAIRLPPIQVGPDHLVGKSPVVVFTEQGAAGANLNDLVLASGDEVAKSLRGGGPAFGIDELVVVLDRSGSMGAPTSPQDRETKLNHIKGQLAKLGADHFPKARLSLIALDDKAEVVDLGLKRDLPALQNALQGILPRGGTQFDGSLHAVSEIFKDSPGATQQGRKVLIFVTDGQDGGNRNLALTLASKIRDQNAGTFIIGVGADYDLENLVKLADGFGFSGWAHTPMPKDGNVFSSLFPKFLAEMQSSEHYLEVTAMGPVAGLYGLTPAIKEARDGVLYLGYQQQGVGVCFVDDAATSLQLQVKAFRADKDGTSKEIPILDISEAAAHFEKTQIAKEAIGPLLVLLAELKSDQDLLNKLADAYPDLAEPIRDLIHNMSRPDDAASRQGVHQAMSIFGTQTANRQPRPVNDLSNLNPPVAGGGANVHLHSGGVGPLTGGDIGPIPPLGRPNPAAYDSLKPRNDPQLSILGGMAAGTFNLGSIKVGSSVVIGRGSSTYSVDVQIEDTTVSRRHCQIRREDNGYYLSDLGSSNGTQLNGRFVKREVKLKPGDQICIGQAIITFRDGAS